jgi:sensor c-di-GMP phosphodiesterase-like protein
LRRGERTDQLEFVASCGVPYLQGWMFTKALPLGQAIEVTQGTTPRPTKN